MSVVDEATATNPIAEYFQRLVDEANAPVRARAEREKFLEKRIPALWTEVRSQNETNRRQQEAHDHAKRSGLDTRSINAQLKKGLEKAKALDLELKVLTSERDAPSIRRVPTFDRRLEAALALGDDAGTPSAIVPTRDMALARLGRRVSSLQHDDDGRLTMARMAFGLVVPIASEAARYSGGQRPKILHWLPTLSRDSSTDGNATPETTEQADATSENSDRVLVVDEGHELVADELPYVKIASSGYHHDRRETERASGVGLWTTSDFVKSIIAGIDRDGVDLDAAEQPTPFHAALRECVLSRTTTETPFPPTAATPTSDEIFAQIKMDWSRLAIAPWSGNIGGHWAKLKYTLENGERVRFWQEAHCDHYGFRVRTRDHTWISGKVFIDTQQPAPEGAVPVEFIRSNSYSDPVARVGRMYIVASEVRD